MFAHYIIVVRFQKCLLAGYISIRAYAHFAKSQKSGASFRLDV